MKTVTAQEEIAITEKEGELGFRYNLSLKGDFQEEEQMPNEKSLFNEPNNKTPFL